MLPFAAILIVIAWITVSNALTFLHGSLEWLIPLFALLCLIAGLVVGIAGIVRHERRRWLSVLGIALNLLLLLSLAVPSTGGGGHVKGQLIQGLSNGRQIQMATMSMATDGIANDDPSLGWPGDLKATGRIASVSDYVNLLVRKDYLSSSDLKVLACAGTKPYQGMFSSGSNGVLVPAFTEENNAFKVFLVKKDDSDDTVFLTSKNYTYNTSLNDPKAKPFGDKGFVVVRKDGSASTFRKTHAQSLSLIGKLPGGGTVESVENCLNPSQVKGAQ